MGRRAGSERRGAVIVETALVTPLLLLIVLGIVEMALLMRDDNALSSYVRDGGRAAAAAVAGDSRAITPASDCTGSSCPGTPTSHWTDTLAAAFTSTESSSAEEAVDELWIYDPNSDGYPGASGRTGFDSCVHACVVYRWSAEQHAFEYASGSWSDDDRAACDAAPDSVGVYARSTHSFLSGIFSDGVRISDHTVFSLASVCANRSS